MNRRLLSTYMNDHLAGAVAGSELAQRSLESNRGTEYEAVLRELAAEIEYDRDALGGLIDELGFRRDVVKQALGWVAEKVGRLKPNARLTGYSPLSRLVELEGLRLGITGKLSLWESLLQLEDLEPPLAAFDLGRFADRAREQLERIEPKRRQAALEALD